MISRHFAFGLVTVALLCVVSIFLFPATTGPYSAVHGPASTLVSLRARMRLRWAMALTALSLIRIQLLLTMDWVDSKPPSQFTPFGVPPSGSILRC